MNSTMTKVAAAAVLAVAASSAHAFTLNNGDVLTISSGATTESGTFVLGSGSFFGMDLNTNSKISLAEATAITGLGGITVGQTTTPGTIDTWFFNNATGMDWLQVALTGGTSGVNMTGWTVNWNGGDIDMSGNAWQSSLTNPLLNNVMNNIGQTYTSGVGNFVWDGVYGSTYTLDYTATVPSGGFAGTQYYLHLTGTVAAVPEASTYGMMLAGLGLVGFAVRRRKLVG